MTLVVAQIHDGGMSLVGDTKITRLGDDAYSRQVYVNACPKIAILRDEVAVGVAGSDPRHVFEELVAIRDQPIDVLLDAMSSMHYASFVVGVLGSVPQVWSVDEGVVEERTAVGRCYAGDLEAYEHFEEQRASSPESLGVAFSLMASMQYLLRYKVVDSVGGFLVRVATTDEGSFRFVRDQENVAPDLLNAMIREAVSNLNIVLTVPEGADPHGYQILPAVGEPPTIGALAYCMPEAGMSWLFRHESPWMAQEIPTGSPSELVRLAGEDHGQALAL